MRSRYSAFALQDARYLSATWHRTTRPSEIEFNAGQQWLLLRIIATATDGDSATVEFTARSRAKAEIHVQHEVSRFVREDGRWFYVAGVVA